MMLQTFRTALAIERGVENNLLLRTWGGLGDQICAEPTLRFALKTFRGCKVSLASEQPELFGHLDFERVYDLRLVQPLWDKYLVFDTIVPPTHLLWEFMSHMLVNCVDFPSICAFRCQLPIAEREVILKPKTPWSFVDDPDRSVIIHAGRHWQSKTFPKAWWDAVINGVVAKGFTPRLIGANTDDNRGTVDITTEGCIDLRNKLTVMESVALLQDAKVLITNDSAPLHMAASGNAWIGYLATCKHPDYITHWRDGQWGWRMQNLSLGGIWDILDYCPNKENKVEAENVGDHLLKWLPEPQTVADWACSKLEWS